VAVLESELSVWRIWLQIRPIVSLGSTGEWVASTCGDFGERESHCRVHVFAAVKASSKRPGSLAPHHALVPLLGPQFVERFPSHLYLCQLDRHVANRHPVLLGRRLDTSCFVRSTAELAAFGPAPHRDHLHQRLGRDAHARSHPGCGSPIGRAKVAHRMPSSSGQSALAVPIRLLNTCDENHRWAVRGQRRASKRRTLVDSIESSS
jgi:hypothetical protein